MAGALVVGESLVDVVRRPDGSTLEHPGGSAANVAVALARLGRPVQLLTAFGDDERGAMLARHLNQSAVGLVADPHTLDRTATAQASIGADGSATYSFDIEWRLPEVELLDPVVVHTCSIGAVLEPGASDVRRLLEALRPTATLSYDVNARPAVTGMGAEVLAAVEQIVAMADLVKASDEDLELLYPGRPVEESVHHLLGLGQSSLILTRGADGATWFSGTSRTDVPAAETEVSDTIGAGDTFGAATIDALFDVVELGGRLPALASVEIESILRYAARAAAVTVSRPGADPPYRHELL